MKILHILNSLNPSGAEVMLEIAMEEWKNCDISCDVLATGIEVGPYSNNMESVGFGIYHIPIKNKIKFVYDLKRFLTSHKYDLIHIHAENASLFAALAARLSGHKYLVRTVHHIWPYVTLSTYFRFLVFRFITNKILRVCAVSNSLSGYENEKKLYFSNNALIPNWYDNNKFKLTDPDERAKIRLKFNIPENYHVFVTLGGNWLYKNYHLVIEALSKMKDIKNKLIMTVDEINSVDKAKLILDEMLK